VGTASGPSDRPIAGVVPVAVLHRVRLFRCGLADLLDGEPDIAVVATAVTAPDLARQAGRARPSVVVLEIEDAGAEACQAAAAVRSAVPGVRFVAIEANRPGPLSAAAVATFPQRVRRADGFRAVAAAVRAAPGRWAAPVIVPASPGADALSPRELDVLSLVSAGCTTREISERLAISRKTVENHKRRIFGKLQVRTQAHAVAVAVRAGMITVDGVLDLAVAAGGR
jgi:two-component system response regulator DesR